MKCPIDDSDLVMSERQGIEIDYCPKCRGVWLDRGELDKIIERSEPTPSKPSFVEPRTEAPQRPSHPESDYGHNQQHNQPYDKKRKPSFLGELFDFGD